MTLISIHGGDGIVVCGENKGHQHGEGQSAIIGQKPFVGFRGTENTITISKVDYKLVCRVKISTYIYVLLMAVLFGPGLTMLLWLQPEGMNRHIPMAVSVVLWSASVFCWSVLLWYIFHSPRIEIPLYTGDIVFFTSRQGRPCAIIYRENIQRFSLIEDTYLDEGTRVPNYVVSVVTREGAHIALCCTPEKVLALSFLKDLAKIIGKTAN